MRGFVEKLRGTMTASFARRGPDASARDGADTPATAEAAQAEADRLTREVFRLYHAGKADEAEAVAAELVRHQEATLGPLHPAYADALGHLADLRQRSGNSAGAEPLRREALQVRLGALGDDHPAVGRERSQLASLLANLGKTAEAVPLLEASVTHRRASLGEKHPDVMADLLLLSRLRGEALPALSATAPNGPLAPGPAQTDPVAGRGGAEVLAEVRGLAGVFTRLGAAMAGNGHDMARFGHPPDPRLLAEATACYRQFAGLCDEAVRRAEALGLEAPNGGRMRSGAIGLGIPELTTLFEQVFRAEGATAQRSETRQRALSVIDGVLALRHEGPDGETAGAPFRGLADRLRQVLRHAPTHDLPEEAARLAAGTHPLCALHRLTTAEDSPDDAAWSADFDQVVAAFGAATAAAVARGRWRPRPGDGPRHGLVLSGTTSARRDDLRDSVLDEFDLAPDPDRRGPYASARAVEVPNEGHRALNGTAREAPVGGRLHALTRPAPGRGEGTSNNAAGAEAGNARGPRYRLPDHIRGGPGPG